MKKWKQEHLDKIAKLLFAVCKAFPFKELPHIEQKKKDIGILDANQEFIILDRWIYVTSYKEHDWQPDTFLVYTLDEGGTEFCHVGSFPTEDDAVRKAFLEYAENLIYHALDYEAEKEAIKEDLV